MSKLTRRGARNFTATLDNVASLVQDQFAVLGIDPKIANDFALRCDMISDCVERTAASNFPRNAADSDAAALKEDADPKSDDQNTKLNATDGPKMAGSNEEGLSVKTEGWDADQIADEESGPLEHEADETEYMATFTESEYHELGGRQEGGTLENGVKSAKRAPQKGDTGEVEMFGKEMTGTVTKVVDDMIILDFGSKGVMGFKKDKVKLGKKAPQKGDTGEVEMFGKEMTGTVTKVVDDMIILDFGSKGVMGFKKDKVKLGKKKAGSYGFNLHA
jgi:preprotein translocase subunit YajC